MRKGTDIIYFGDTDEENKSQLCEQLPEFDILQGDLEGGIYLDGESQHLVKQMDFQFPDKIEGSVFIISNVDDLLPEVKYMIREMPVSYTHLDVYKRQALCIPFKVCFRLCRYRKLYLP